MSQEFIDFENGCILQANAKEMFEDDDLDLSSGSDFDDDEDPDKIEVPGKWNSLFLMPKLLSWKACNIIVSAKMFRQNCFGKIENLKRNVRDVINFKGNQAKWKWPFSSKEIVLNGLFSESEIECIKYPV